MTRLYILCLKFTFVTLPRDLCFYIGYFYVFLKKEADSSSFFVTFVLFFDHLPNFAWSRGECRSLFVLTSNYLLSILSLEAFGRRSGRMGMDTIRCKMNHEVW